MPISDVLNIKLAVQKQLDEKIISIYNTLLIFVQVMDDGYKSS